MANQPDADKLDCFARVVTPENIAFEYTIAGPFQRLPAFVFDIALRTVVYSAAIFLLSFVVGFLGIAGILLPILALISYFLFSWFYGIYFESRFNGRTPGKMVFKLRVISVDGRPINAAQAGLRNLLRLADMGVILPLQIFSPEAPPRYIFPTMLIGMVTMLFTRRMQRIGDLAAGTMVVSEQSKRSPWNLQPDDTRAYGLAELIPASFSVSSSLAQTIGLYMENRKRLSPGRRQEIAENVANPLIRQFEMLPDTSPDLLMCALYVRVFLSEEQRTQGVEAMRKQTQRVQPQNAALNRTAGAFPIPQLSSLGANKTPTPVQPSAATAPMHPANPTQQAGTAVVDNNPPDEN